MRFMVTAEQMPGTGPADPEQMAGFLQNVMMPSVCILEQWEQEGKAKGGVFVGERKGVMIVDAESFEELDRMLISLPFWPVMEWEIKALISSTAGTQRIQQVINRAQATSAG